jgi:CRP/FNR family cyclic AMP-dependent transcriptional regulator
MKTSQPAGRPAIPRPRLSPQLQELLVGHGVIRTLNRDTIVVHAGETAESLHLVLEGKVQLYLDDASGRTAELQRLDPGDCFGIVALSRNAHAASARTLCATKLCSVAHGEFEALLGVRPDLALYVLHALIGRVQSLTDHVRGLALMDVYGRVARLLSESAGTVAGVRRMINLSQKSIAERVGASPAMVNRILQELAAEGFILSTRGQIELLRDLPLQR